MPYIEFLGAAGTVTGSKHLVNTAVDESGKAGMQVLVECGLFQGPKEWCERNWQPLPIPAAGIDAVILTHAHLDHCGWIPRLVQQGFRGPIYATPATIELCGILLPDSGHLQEEDAGFHNKHKSARHDPALPLYTLAEAQACLQYFKPVEVGEQKQLADGFSFRFYRAAHMLGSSMAEITLNANGSPRKLVFTGDIGRVRDTAPGVNDIAPGKVMHGGPDEPGAPDVLVMESTYGNRLHPTDDPRPQLARLVRETVERGGSVVVPAFAVERTQKFVFMLKELMESGQMPQVPVRAQIAALEQFSDHADTPELLQWLRTFPKPPSATYLVHGDPAASAQLKQAMTSALGWHVEVAQWLEKVKIS